MRNVAASAPVIVLLAALVPAAGAVPSARPAPGREPTPERLRGVNWVAGRGVDAADLAPLAAHHVNSIAQTPFGWQDSPDTPAVRLVTSGRVLWGETDEGLRTTAELARERGVGTLLKPHIWVRGSWPGEIRMGSDEDWSRWFADYRTFILHYARFAQEHDIEMLCIGTELHHAAVDRPDDWRRLIDEIRAVYEGPLVYAANWYREYEEIEFWDRLDAIGIQAYFPLTDDADPTAEALTAAWQPHLEAIAALQARVGKPVIFTEAGYRSWPDAAARPWEWPERGRPAAVDPALQERLYEALFRTFWHREWFAGVYWWKWYPQHARAGGPADADFTPQNKPAARVIAAWFEAARGGTY